MERSEQEEANALGGREPLLCDEDEEEEEEDEDEDDEDESADQCSTSGGLVRKSTMIILVWSMPACRESAVQIISPMTRSTRRPAAERSILPQSLATNLLHRQQDSHKSQEFPVRLTTCPGIAQ